MLSGDFAHPATAADAKSVFEKGHGQRLIRVADAAMVMRVSATPVSCS